MRELIKQIHASDGKLVLATAGGGTAVIAWLMGVPGASRTVLEMLVPYSRQAFDEFVGRPVQRYATEQSGQWLAGRAIAHAQQLSEERVIGVGCTAAIVTEQPSRSDHRAHITIWTRDQVVNHHLVLAKGARDRIGEESMLGYVLLNGIAHAYGIDERVPIVWLDDDCLETTVSDITTPLSQLYAGKIDWMCVDDAGGVHTADVRPDVLLSGSFNPLHHGHLRLAEAASDFLGKPVSFELAVFNADKPMAAQTEAARRMVQFAGRYPVYVSNARTFVEKMRVYGATTFVVGFDTAERIVMPRFYHDSKQEMLAALDQLMQQGCRFLVSGRTGRSISHLRWL